MSELRRARRSAGYTLIEVMVSIAISAIGISGIVFMQSATVRSNQDAQETQVATVFARSWIERIRRDAVMWTALGPPPLAQILAGRNLGIPNSANYFVPTAFNDGVWDVPIPIAGALESSGANYHGVDVGALDPLLGAGLVPVTNRDIYYCANTKFTTVHLANNLANAIRADVRVWWSRKSSLNETDYTPSIGQVRAGGCESWIPTSAQLRDRPLYRFRVVYLSTYLRWTTPT
jgi:prepilin-type N-terminal cleavage/methylation domain-containing protein